MPASASSPSRSTEDAPCCNSTLLLGGKRPSRINDATKVLGPMAVATHRARPCTTCAPQNNCVGVVRKVSVEYEAALGLSSPVTNRWSTRSCSEEAAALLLELDSDDDSSSCNTTQSHGTTSPSSNRRMSPTTKHEASYRIHFPFRRTSTSSGCRARKAFMLGTCWMHGSKQQIQAGHLRGGSTTL